MAGSPAPCTWVVNDMRQYLLLCLLIGTPLLAQAETLRCSNKLVSLGDRSFEVLEKCGEPASRDQVGYKVGAYDKRETRIEEWIYQQGDDTLSILTFEGNRLTGIERKRRN